MLIWFKRANLQEIFFIHTLRVDIDNPRKAQMNQRPPNERPVLANTDFIRDTLSTVSLKIMPRNLNKIVRSASGLNQRYERPAQAIPT